MLIYLQRVHQLNFNKEIFISRMHGANIKIISTLHIYLIKFHPKDDKKSQNVE